MVRPPPVKGIISDTRTFTVSSSDGYIYSQSDTYTTVWNDSDGDTLSNAATTAYVGQSINPDFIIDEFSFVSRSPECYAIQGVEYNGTNFWTTSGTYPYHNNLHIFKFDSDWNLLDYANTTLDEPIQKTQINSIYLHSDGYLYIGANNWATYPAKSWIVVYDANTLDYVTYYNVSSSGHTEGCTYYNNLWWVCYHSWSYVDTYDNSWVQQNSYQLTYSSQRYQGIRWINDYIYVNNHETDANPSMDVYYWTGSGFSPQARLTRPSANCTQGFCLDPDNANVMYWADRWSSGPDPNYVVNSTFTTSLPYTIDRSYVFFDTSSLPDGASITSAKLSLYVNSDDSDDDFNVTIQNGQPTYPHNPLVVGDYYRIRYSGNGGSRNTSEIGGAGYWNITLSSIGRSWISTTGTTKFCLRSNKDINGEVPLDYERIRYYTSEQGSSYTVKLFVSYQVASEDEITYNFYGPYYENGTVCPDLVIVELYQLYNDTVTFTLDGSGGVDSEQVILDQEAVSCVWNISSGGNYTRVRYFTGGNEDVIVFVPNEDSPFGIYKFTISDFYGITDGYLQSMIFFNGTNAVVESQKLDLVNSVPFYMGWGQKYDMRIICDEGTLSIGSFIALSETGVNLIIPSGAFAFTVQGLNVTATAVRYSSTFIQVNYTDFDSVTTNVTVTILYRENANTDDYTTAYSEYTTTQTFQVNWNSADADTDYLARVCAYRDGAYKTWWFSLPYYKEGNNPFAPLDNLGTFSGSPSPTSTPMSTPSPTSTPFPTSTASPTSTPTPTTTITPTISPSPTQTPQPRGIFPSIETILAIGIVLTIAVIPIILVLLRKKK